MHIYFSGIGGVGIGPLIQIARDAGHTVSGSDLRESQMTGQLRSEGIQVAIGQDGTHIAVVHEQQPIDWFVYTAALDEGKPELDFCVENNIRTSKRDELLAEIIEQKDLKLIAVAGTHGKTTTTGMLAWAFKQLRIPSSYSVGASLSFGPSGKYTEGSEYFIYECDEFDRNFLHFQPHTTIITSLDYDHPDTYPTEDEYRSAFMQFLEQSGYCYMWEKDLRYLRADPQADLEAYDEFTDVTSVKLPGKHVRQNGYLVERAMIKLFPDISPDDIRQAINGFPGTGRRMEKLGENLYSDYAHHPVEIAATIQLARELNDHVVAVYQPHQNVRQHEVKADYKDAFSGADTVYWLPTYLSREDTTLPVLTPEELITSVDESVDITVTKLDDTLWKHISEARSTGSLVLCMGAGDIDAWIREQLNR